MKIRKRHSMLFAIIFCVLCFANVSRAATPRVIVSGYKIKENEVTVGKEFTLEITLDNTSQRIIKNMQLSVLADGGEFVPVKDAGTAYIDQIDAESEKTISFAMKAIVGLEEKSYKVAVKMKYENTGGYEYSEEEILYIPVHLDARIDISQIIMDPPMECQLGDTVEIMGEVNNLGAGTVYNVRAGLAGESVDESNQFIGNIESGKSGTIDLLTNAVKVTTDGNVMNKIIVTYEDKEGNAFTEEKKISLVVRKPEYKNLEKVKDGNSASELIKILSRWLVVIVFLGVIVFYLYKRKKRKARLLEEFIEG